MKLKSEICDDKTRTAIVRAAKKAGLRGMPAFEHGHWWFLTLDGRNFDVVDAEGEGSFDGFGFEGLQ